LERRIKEGLARLPVEPGKQMIERGVVLPALQVLGWKVFDPREVWPRFDVGHASVDLALCDCATSRAQCLIALHGASLRPETVESTRRHARRANVPLALLTNGSEWRLYVVEIRLAAPCFEIRVGENGDLPWATFVGLLDRNAVLSGATLKAALSTQGLETAWSALTARKDGLLVEILSDEVRDQFGLKPDEQDVVDFLRQLRAPERVLQPPGALSPSPPIQRPHRRRVSLVVCGKRLSYGTAVEAVVALLVELYRRDEGFLEACANDRRFCGKKRHYLARSTDAIYLGSPHLEEHHAELVDGWYLGTNSSNAQKKQQMRAATEVAGLEFGKDVVVDFGAPD